MSNNMLILYSIVFYYDSKSGKLRFTKAIKYGRHMESVND
jgi:hypothetical protein